MTKESYVVTHSPVAGTKPIKAWISGIDLDIAHNEKVVNLSHTTTPAHIESAALQQLHNIAGMPFIHKHLAVMPDVHLGKGATVGSVIATKGAIIPAAVGVDIGCGMMAVKTDLTASDLPDSLAEMRVRIERAIPHGRTNNGKEGDRGAWHDVPSHVRGGFEASSAGQKSLAWRMFTLVEQHPKLKRPAERAIRHLGTLGTGNHFVEVCLDEAQAVWVMLHSGSRGIGNAIGTYFIDLAKEDMRRWFINLPDQDLAYLPEGSDHFADYIAAMTWAQDYAMENRRLMMHGALDALRRSISKPFDATLMAVNCHHNYATKEHHFGENVFVTRKGAVCAREGVLGIIPGSMGTRSYIVRGLGNPESFHSCSHGAGRRMSRGEASRRITLEDHIKATEGVECRKDKDVIDESPAAYKDIDAVMAAQSDLVEVVATLKQVLCVKG
jgi:tRNA-splicing ligase RtcB (3'-phosphate/5'-hydroxy nucleic acid ligase)